ncbi:MAG: efflux RND transporter periplasmic adaptor subunit [Thermochromatium sp.]
MKKTLLITLILLALFGGAVLAIRHKRIQVAERPAAGIPAVVVSARQLAAGPVTLTLPVTVEVLATREAILASRLSANITDLTYLEGDGFKRGDVLVRLDLAQAEADRLRAEAELARVRLQEASVAADLAAARSNLEAEQARNQRLKALLAAKAVAVEPVQVALAALDAARARETSAENAVNSYRALLEATEAQAAAARENLRYGVIAAPFDGVVTQRLAQPGDLATPGKPLLKVMDLSAGVRLLVDVPDNRSPRNLYLGNETLPLTPWPKAVAQGMARFEARSKAALKPGTRVSARLEIFHSDSAVLLPRDCLLGDDGGRAAVLQLLDQGQVQRLEVAVAAQGEEGVASTDMRLVAAPVACASPDILIRLLAGAPYVAEP